MINLIGWLGSTLVLITYIMNIRGIWNVDHKHFLLYNLIGGIFLGFYTFYHEAYATTVLESIFISFTFYKIYEKTRKNTNNS